MRGRVDSEEYFNGAETLENVLVNSLGNAENRPGTHHVQRVKDVSKATRVIPFQFSTTQAYTLEFGDQYIRFFRNQGSIVETAVNITGATQADPVVITATAHGFSDGDYVDIAGVVGMTEINGKRFIVANKTANTFELTDEDANDVDGSAYTAYASGGTASRVYEISSPYLEADLRKIQFAQEADVMYLVHPGYAPRKLSRTGHTAWTLTQPDFGDGPYLPQNSTAITMTPSVTTGSGTLTASSAFFTSDHVGAIFKLHGGYVKVDAFTSSTVVDITVQDTLSATTATAVWSEGAWSTERGFPGAVTFYEQRLMFAGSTFKPQTVWGSVSEDYENMLAGSNDTDALLYTIATEQVNAIRWLSAGKVLLLGTSGGPFSLSGGTTGDPLTPSNVRVQRESTYGAADLTPARIGHLVYYFGRDSLKLRELSYNFDFDGYLASDMTRLADHITESGIVDLAYQQDPDSILWCVRSDGKIATFTRYINPGAGGVASWQRQVTDGLFESVAVIPTATYDEVWFIVNRTINGQTRRFVEYLNAPTFDDQEDAFYVDCGLTYDGAAATTMSGLDHLEAESVAVLTDGATHPNETVSSGAITLDRSASVVHAGLGMTATIKTMPMEAGSGLGTAQAKPKRIAKVAVRLRESLGLKVGTDDTQDTVYFRDPTMAMDSPPPLFTGDKEVVFPQGWNKDAQVTILQDLPLPMRVLGLVLFAETSDG